MDSSTAFTIGISIVIAGYFIGNGIKNGLIHFGKGKIEDDTSSMFDTINKQDEDIKQVKFVGKRYLARYLGIPSKQVDDFINQYPDIPSINIGKETYYIREELNEWVSKIHYKK